jgi:hypothetical protein
MRNHDAKALSEQGNSRVLGMVYSISRVPGPYLLGCGHLFGSAEIETRHGAITERRGHQRTMTEKFHRAAADLGGGIM